MTDSPVLIIYYTNENVSLFAVESASRQRYRRSRDP